MKNTHPHTKLLAVIFIGVVIMLLWKVIDAKKMQMYDQSNQITAPQQLQTYRSDLMKFSIDHPNNWSLIEGQTQLTFTTIGGTILITRIATNFNDIDSYLDNLMTANKLILNNKEASTSNNLQMIKGEINENNNSTEKIYFIYADGWVYTLSTTSPELYDDLDAIAQSFRYTP